MRLTLRTVAVVFLVFGAFWGTWAVAAADVQRALHLSPGGLGLLLSGSVGVGGLAAAASGAMAERWGTRVFLVRAVALWGAAAALAGVFSDMAVFVTFFVVAMVAAGLVDMAMNAGAAAGVGGDARRMMQFHALFNSGALCGAALTGALIGVHHSWHWSWIAVGALGVVIATVVARARPGRGAASVAPPAASLAPPAAPVTVPPVLTVPPVPTAPTVPTARTVPTAGTARAPAPGDLAGSGLVRSLAVVRSMRLTPLALAFVATAGVEGGIDTWGVLYLRRQLAAGILLGAGAYGLGQIIAITVRGAGAAPVGRLGPRWGLVAGAGVAAAGLVLESMSHVAVAAAVGLVLAAAGISVCWPLAMSTVSGRAAEEEMSPAPLVGALTASGYVGWVAGPAVVGLVADGAGLRAGLLVLAALAAAACAGLATVPTATRAR